MKFNLRDLLWLILVAGIGCAFWVERRSAAVWQARAETLRQLVDTFEDPNYVEWTPNGATLVYARKKPREATP